MNMFRLAPVLLLLVPSALAAQSKKEAHAGLGHKRVIVEATNDEWTRTDIRANSGDLIVIIAKGVIKIGEWAGEVGASGFQDGNGALFAKVGTGASFRVGSRFVFYAEKSGTLKLRVKDGRYDDNSGNFEVTVLHIPPAVIPEAEVVEAD